MEIRLDDSAHPVTRLFGRRLKERRKALGLTQGQLFDRTGINNGYISQVENGRANPTLDMILKLADAIELEAWAMLRPDAPPSEPTPAAPATVGDLDLSVRLVNTLGAASPAGLVGEVLDNGAHPLRSKLRARDLKQLAEARHEAGVI
ncbi:helix-turn-helix domain-containing protein [Sphingomonas sp. PAMC 26605]|uniref:helix-turn-helix domain-containing protein n=1 Tax=Sphingomonas sp. PAMC 26605 TaxID=1112214 RepID=UPI00026CAD04|nr:helix-turn-helix transcriptional regulator [Sphingomonas sp. PAMC 26605]